MENASKALIIAGAILISILLISVGIIIMNAINDPVSKGADAATSQATQIFNSQFTGFMGTDIDYNTAKQFFVTVTSANSTATVKLTSKSAAPSGKTLVTNAAALKRDKKYSIELTDEKKEDGTTGQDGYYDTYVVYY